MIMIRFFSFLVASIVLASNGIAVSALDIYKND